MEGIYFFGEHIRWNFGFVNPNIAGAIIATILIFFSALNCYIPQNKNKLKYLNFIILLCTESSLFFCLAKTYSRGALVAYIISFILCNLFFYLYRKVSLKSLVKVFSLKLIIFSIIIFATSFFARISPEFIKDDGSIGARATLWQGGLKMVATSPMQAWGVDNSGKEYINYFQPLEDNREYAGMVNSYLHISVERGLFVLFLSIFACFFLILLGLENANTLRTKFATASSFAILSIMLSNIFSTLWLVEEIQYTFFAFAIIILFTSIFNFNLKIVFKKCLLAMLLSLFICFAIYIFALCLNDNSISKENDYVSLNSKVKSKPKIAMLLDEKVLGKYPAKEIRKAINPLNLACDIHILKNIESLQNKEYSSYIIFGKNAKFLSKLSSVNVKKILINPIGLSPKEKIENLQIFIPTIDTFNQNRYWQRYSKAQNIKITPIEATSSNINLNELIKIFKEL